jgi:geranylgeranyl diphosphate synthase type II
MAETQSPPFSQYTSRLREQIDAALSNHTRPADGCPTRLREAMRYALLGPGKRLRPLLVLMAAEACEGPVQAAMPAACAVEMVHAYSLVHDDLPAMDDDDFRRGRPSCHKAFDEATAILAGDALLTLAFEIVAGPPCGSHAAAFATELARGAGTQGMLAGQMADMVFEGAEPTAEAVNFIHQHKTAALIATSLRLGALAADAPQATVDRLGRFGHSLGLAFQITDDALDVDATTEQLGKTAGKDAASGKVTYPAVFGLAGSRARARQLVAEAAHELEPFGPAADLLRDLAHYVVERKA